MVDMMDISFSNEFCYMSACSFSQEMCFYSAPTSPSRLKLRAPFGSQTGPTTPRAATHEDDADSNVNEFEFETSRRFNVSVGDLDTETNQKDENLFGDSLQTMAFADELFCDGKVLPLMPPLKLPPRMHQNGDGSIMSTHSSTLTSPRSPGSVLRLRFSRQSLWNDDFDPFMVALEKVREEKRGNPSARHGLRRTRSLSPFRSFNKKSEKNVGISKSSQLESHCCDTAQLVCELNKEPLKQVSGRINVLSEPKGLMFAKQVRLVGVSNDTTTLERTSVSKVATETKKDEGKRGGFWRRNKRENIKKFLFGTSNMWKANAHHKLEDKIAAQEKQPLVRKLDMKSVKATESTQWDKDPRTGELTKMRLVCHRPLPRFFLCLGYEEGKVK
ncbi:hypothetical protein AAZX31_14G035300 [Glycine max]|uniref:Uncharacterized protein n=1 Tax=Glycine soja TaxID=3848 RepID=A0A0B2PTX7_GLYSO|nr:uncharacterized protein LOC114384856 [Glycine soja]KAG4964510.1 hypothetical protein JHK85_039485 [Glycine max]KAG5120788.1 hypothetical protein JHK84_039128 [Glycine max]KHN11012.1 hypothetical protein glysoja_047262 [Glycine soja]RZB67296.1 hypothetical protein D0Y65_037598 [Glycine soja]